MTAPADTSTLDAFLSFDPLLVGEDAAAYEALRQHMRADLTPEGAIERIWTDEIISLTWQRRQYACFRAHILATAQGKLLWNLLGGHLGSRTAAAKSLSVLLARYAARDADAVAHVEGLLAAKGTEPALVVAQAHRTAWAELDQVERLTAALERRRERLLREVERHQAFAARLRATMKQYEHLTSGPGAEDSLKRPPTAAEIARELRGRAH